MIQAAAMTHDPVVYKAEQRAKMARMSGQIAEFFQSYPDEQAVPAIAGHINEFWPGRMREEFLAAFDAGSPELHPLVRRALTQVRPAQNS
jgi:formate dehydrogenase subunit delta